MSEKRKNWPDVLLSHFNGRVKQYNQFYELFLAPFCMPTRSERTEGTTVSAFCTDKIRAMQEVLLNAYSEIISEAAEHLDAVRKGETHKYSPLNVPEDMIPPLENVIQFMALRVDEEFDDIKRPNIGCEMIRRAGNRFLSGFALEKDARTERIRSVLAYYKLCIHFLYPEDDGLALCELLRRDLESEGIWREPEDLPEDSAFKAANLLLAYLFLHFYMLQTFDSLPNDTKLQLREASKVLGFIDPGAQEPSRRSVLLDAEVLQEVIMLPLAREFQSYQDSEWICFAITRVLKLLSDGNSIIPGFGMWLKAAGAVLKKQDDHLYEASASASKDELEKTMKVQKMVSELRNTIRSLRFQLNEL